MFVAIIIIAIIWLYGDYRKDRKIEKCLQKEKEQAQKNCRYIEETILESQEDLGKKQYD